MCHSQGGRRGGRKQSRAGRRGLRAARTLGVASTTATFANTAATASHMIPDSPIPAMMPPAMAKPMGWATWLPSARNDPTRERMTILVTGATGYLGPRIIDALVAQGHEVRAMTRDTRRFDAAAHGADCRFSQADKQSIRQWVVTLQNAAPTGSVGSVAAMEPGRLTSALGMYRGRPGAQAMLAFVVVLAIAVVIGIAALWPQGAAPSSGGMGKTLGAEVVAVETRPCAAAPGIDGGDCRRVTVRVSEGPEAGSLQGFDVASIPVDVGDSVRVVRSQALPPGGIGGVQADQHAFNDFERGSALLVLAVAFALLVIVAARWKGLRALVGLAISLLIVIGFMIPAILSGQPPVAVALVGALAVMLVTIPIAHGVSPRSIAAIIGTTVALLVTLTLISLFAGFTHLTGFASEEATYLRAFATDLSLRDLLIAGVVIATLGVLDDLTVSQASTVMALRAANPRLGSRDLFRRAMAVGHDHVAATVNTLVLAYAGAALPVLLVFGLADASFTTAVTSEAVAAEVVATLVGSIGLVLAAPLTTAVAAYLAVRLPAEHVSAPGAHTH